MLVRFNSVDEVLDSGAHPGGAGHRTRARRVFCRLSARTKADLDYLEQYVFGWLRAFPAKGDGDLVLNAGLVRLRPVGQKAPSHEVTGYQSRSAPLCARGAKVVTMPAQPGVHVRAVTDRGLTFEEARQGRSL